MFIFKIDFCLFDNDLNNLPGIILFSINSIFIRSCVYIMNHIYLQRNLTTNNPQFAAHPA